MSQSVAEATQILRQMREGDSSAARRLIPLVYEDLRGLAGGYFRSRRKDHTLQPTALVHEAFVRLIDQANIDWQDREHFMAAAAQAMRWILADHARGRRALKRGGGRERVEMGDLAESADRPPFDLLALDEALTKLAALDERHARIVELRFFGGLTEEEMARVLGCSRTTVQTEWRVVRAWLIRELRDEAGA